MFQGERIAGRKIEKRERIGGRKIDTAAGAEVIKLGFQHQRKKEGNLIKGRVIWSREKKTKT